MKENEKPITRTELRDEMGILLLKHLSPIYDELGQIKGILRHHGEDISELKKDVKGLYKRVDDVENIQLRMENRLIDDNKLLHDRDDIHDKKLKDHDHRITKLEKIL